MEWCRNVADGCCRWSAIRQESERRPARSRVDARPPEPLRKITEERSEPINKKKTPLPPTLECYVRMRPPTPRSSCTGQSATCRRKTRSRRTSCSYRRRRRCRRGVGEDDEYMPILVPQRQPTPPGQKSQSPGSATSCSGMEAAEAGLVVVIVVVVEQRCGSKIVFDWVVKSALGSETTKNSFRSNSFALPRMRNNLATTPPPPTTNSPLDHAAPQSIRYCFCVRNSDWFSQQGRRSICCGQISYGLPGLTVGSTRQQPQQPQQRGDDKTTESRNRPSYNITAWVCVKT
jgi:hypothetical protein